MEQQFQYIIKLAQKYNEFVLSPDKLYEAINNLNLEAVRDVYNDYNPSDKNFMPVNLLRAEIARRLLDNADNSVKRTVDDKLVEEIKSKIKTKDL